MQSRAFSPPAFPPFNKKAPSGVEMNDEIVWKGQRAAKNAWPWAPYTEADGYKRIQKNTKRTGR